MRVDAAREVNRSGLTDFNRIHSIIQKVVYTSRIRMGGYEMYY